MTSLPLPTTTASLTNPSLLNNSAEVTDHTSLNHQQPNTNTTSSATETTTVRLHRKLQQVPPGSSTSPVTLPAAPPLDIEFEGVGASQLLVNGNDGGVPAVDQTMMNDLQGSNSLLNHHPTGNNNNTSTSNQSVSANDIPATTEVDCRRDSTNSNSVAAVGNSNNGSGGGVLRSPTDGLHSIDSYLPSSRPPSPTSGNLLEITSPTITGVNISASQAARSRGPSFQGNSFFSHQPTNASMTNASMTNASMTNTSITTYLNNSTGRTLRMRGQSQPIGSEMFNSFFTATPSLPSCNGSFMLSSGANLSMGGASTTATNTTNNNISTPAQQYFYVRTQGGDMAVVSTNGQTGGSSASTEQLDTASNFMLSLPEIYSADMTQRPTTTDGGSEQHNNSSRRESTDNHSSYPPPPMSGTNSEINIKQLLQQQQPMVAISSPNSPVMPFSTAMPSTTQSSVPRGPPTTTSSAQQLPPTQASERKRDNLYVSGLPPDCRDKHLQRLFAPFGEIVSASVRMDIRTGRSRGFGFVKYSTEEDAVNALNAMSGKQLLTVTEGTGSNSSINLITPDELRAREEEERNGGDCGGVGHTSVVSASPVNVVFAQNDADYHPAKLINKVFARNFPSTVDKERVKEFFEQFEGFVSLVYQVSSNDAAEAAKSAMLAASSGSTAPIVFISAYVTYDTVENAIKAAQQAHSTVPFPEEQKAAAAYMERVRQEDQKRANGGRGWVPPHAQPDPIPILAKVAEAHDARRERLGKKATPGSGGGGADGHHNKHQNKNNRGNTHHHVNSSSNAHSPQTGNVPPFAPMMNGTNNNNHYMQPQSPFSSQPPPLVSHHHQHSGGAGGPQYMSFPGNSMSMPPPPHHYNNNGNVFVGSPVPQQQQQQHLNQMSGGYHHHQQQPQQQMSFTQHSNHQQQHHQGMSLSSVSASPTTSQHHQQQQLPQYQPQHHQHLNNNNNMAANFFQNNSAQSQQQQHPGSSARGQQQQQQQHQFQYPSVVQGINGNNGGVFNQTNSFAIVPDTNHSSGDYQHIYQQGGGQQQQQQHFSDPFSAGGSSYHRGGY